MSVAQSNHAVRLPIYYSTTINFSVANAGNTSMTQVYCPFTPDVAIVKKVVCYFADIDPADSPIYEVKSNLTTDSICTFLIAIDADGNGTYSSTESTKIYLNKPINGSYNFTAASVGIQPSFPSGAGIIFVSLFVSFVKY